MKCTRLTLDLLLLVAVLVLTVLVISHMAGENEAERLGPQSSPPASGDWVINTAGNVIIDETFMMEIRHDGNSLDRSARDDSVYVYGNLIIMPGGELTLINASLTFDDRGGDGVHIEVDGKLTMEASGQAWDHVEQRGDTTVIVLIITNNSGLRVRTARDEHDNFEPVAPLIRHVNVSGTFIMGEIGCGINHMNQESGYIKVENGRFDGASLMKIPELAISGSYVNITDSQLGSDSLDEDRSTISIIDSTVTLKRSLVSSNVSVAMFTVRSEVTTVDCTFAGSARSHLSRGVLVEDSVVTITGGELAWLQDYAIRTSGDTSLLVDGATFIGLNRDAPDDGRYALDLHSNSDIIQNCEFRSKCRAPLIGARGPLFKLLDNDLHNLSGVSVVYYGTGRAEIMGNRFYDIEGTAAIVRNAAELEARYNNFSYTRKWSTGLGEYVVSHIWENGLVVEDVGSFTIENNLFQKTGKSALVIVDSPEGVIRNNNFSKLGHEAQEKLHGIFMDRSFATIEDNGFSGSTLQHGFEVFVVGHGGDNEDLVIDGTELVTGNIFNDTITNKFAQTWELTVRTADPSGNPVRQVTIKLSTENISELLYTDSNGLLGPVHVYDHTITGENELTSYNLYTINANITRNDVSFSASGQLAPDHHQQVELMINPLHLGNWLSLTNPASGHVLNSFSATLSFHVFNQGPGTIYQDFTLSYRQGGEGYWTTIDEIRLPIFSGEQDYSYVWTDILGIGVYDIMVSLAGNVSVEPSRVQAVNPEGLEVFTRPSVSFDLEEDVMISGKEFVITGTAMDSMTNTIARVELVIERGGVNGTKLFPEFTGKGNHWNWAYVIDTTATLNGHYRLWVKAVNEASNGTFARSSWESVTVIINNEPTLEITGTIPDNTKPEQEVLSKTLGNAILVQGTIGNLYNNTHILQHIDVSIDSGAPREVEMKLNFYPTVSTWLYTWDDFLAFADGPHELVFTGYYNNSRELVALDPVSITIKIDSDRPETDPALTINAEKPMDEDGNFHISGSASDDWELTQLQYKLGDGGQWNDLLVLEEGTTATDWSLLLDYTELLVGPNYIYVKTSDGFEETETFTILSFAYSYDLEVLELIIPSMTNTSENFTVTTRIHNEGPHDTPPGVALHAYIGSIQKEKFITVMAGETKEFEFSFSMAEAGSFTGKVIVNPGMRTEESDNTNNEMEAQSKITITDLSAGDGNDGDDSGIFEGNTLLVAAGILVILFIATAAAYYSFSRNEGSETVEPFKRLRQSLTLHTGREKTIADPMADNNDTGIDESHEAVSSSGETGEDEE